MSASFAETMGEEPSKKKEGSWFKEQRLVLGLFLTVLDQLSKALVRHWPLGERHALIPGFFWLTHTQNTGASFSMLTGNNTLLIFVALFVLGLLLYYHDAFTTTIERLAYVLLVSGLLGNLLDRVFFGSVTDLLDLGWFPVFNLADSALVVGVALLLWCELRKRKGQRSR